jgi:hypothetical protein
MTKPRRSWLIVLGLLTIISLRLALGNSEPSEFLTYSAAERTYLHRGDFPLNRIVAGWVDDVNQDRIPDLVLAFRPNRSRVARKLGQLREPWWAQVYSGDGSGLLQEFKWDDPKVNILGVLGSEGSLDQIRFVLGMPKMFGSYSNQDGFVKVTGGGIQFREALVWNPSTWGPYVHQSKTELILGEFRDGAKPQSLPLKTDFRRQYFRPKFLPGGPGALQSTLAILGVKKTFEPTSENVWLTSFAAPDWQAQATIMLARPEKGDFSADAVIGHFDQNQDGVMDWLLWSSDPVTSRSYQSGDYAWFDGKSGNLLPELSQSWSRYQGGRPPLQLDLGAGISSGLLSLSQSRSSPNRVEISFRKWTSNATDWSLLTPLPVAKLALPWKVTEFPDLDGDAVADLGVVIAISKENSSFLYPNANYALLWAALISGASGEPLLNSVR